MNLLNKVMMIGNLTGDPVVRETGNGNVFASMSIALNALSGPQKEGESKGEDTTFVDVVLWDRMAENASQYLQKGSGVLIEGRLQQHRWEDKETGQKRSKLQVVGERMRFMANGRRGGEGDHAGGGKAEGRTAARGESASPPSNGGSSGGTRSRRREYAT